MRLAFLAARATAWAVSTPVSPAKGTCSSSTASTPGSVSTVFKISTQSVGLAPKGRPRGLATRPPARSLSRAREVSSEKRASRPPWARSASAAMMPAEAPLTMMARRSPRTGLAPARVWAASKSPSMLSTRSMPARRKATS